MYLEHYDEERLKKYYEEFGVTEESIQRDVKHLIEWLEKQPHLPKVQDEEFLSNFLLRCKNSIERTKTQLEMYYINRATFPEIFDNRDPCALDIQKCVNLCMYVTLPKITPDGYRISIFRFFDHDKNVLPEGECFLKTIHMLMDISLKKDKIKGLIVIYDFQNIDMKIVSIILSQTKKVMQLSTKAIPIHYYKIIIFCTIPSIEQVVTLYNSLLKKELADRVKIWKKKPKDLVEIFPKDVLPSNYGGTLPPIEELRDQWYNYIKEFRDWFIFQNNVKADLDKIPKNSKLKTDLSNYGLEGSFRKIAIT